MQKQPKKATKTGLLQAGKPKTPYCEKYGSATSAIEQLIRASLALGERMGLGAVGVWMRSVYGPTGLLLRGAISGYERRESWG